MKDSIKKIETSMESSLKAHNSKCFQYKLLSLPEVKKYMLPRYRNSDEKYPLIAGNSYCKRKISYQNLGQSAGNHRGDEASETNNGLSNQWLNWLTGFIEADGSFPDSKKNSLTFYISQSIINAPLLYAIRFWLGFGKIRWQHTLREENMVHYVIEDISSLLILANILNGRFRTEEKFEAYLKFVNRLNQKSKVKHHPVTIKPLNNFLDYNWLAGFTEGDGSFFIGLGNTPKSKLGLQLTLNISWTQKQKKTLDLIASEFNGTYSYNKRLKFWVFTIKRQSDIKNLLLTVLVENPIYGIKRLDYLDLVRACEMFKTKHHLTEEGLDLILKIRSNMNAKRKV